MSVCVCVCVCVCVFTCPKVISKLLQVAGTAGEGKSMMLFCGLENGVLMRIAMDAVTGTIYFASEYFCTTQHTSHINDAVLLLSLTWFKHIYISGLLCSIYIF